MKSCDAELTRLSELFIRCFKSDSTHFARIGNFDQFAFVLLLTGASPFVRAWINELLAKITAPELAKDVAGAEALLARHAEYQAELQTRQDAVDAVSGAHTRSRSM